MAPRTASFQEFSPRPSGPRVSAPYATNADAIVTEHLSKSYGPKWVVRDLNLRVPTDCVYGFLGRNGAGKSTTIKMLTGMAHPNAGCASLLDEDVAPLKPSTRARIAYMAEGHPLSSCGAGWCWRC